MSPVSIYVIKCRENKYYVGRSTNVLERIQNHKSGNGSQWTKKYGILETEVYHNCDRYDEDKYVLKLMERHGIDNVRGGSYSQMELSDDQIRNIQMQIANANDLCFNCLGDHFVKDCREPNINEDTINGDIDLYRFDTDKDRGYSCFSLVAYAICLGSLYSLYFL